MSVRYDGITYKGQRHKAPQSLRVERDGKSKTWDDINSLRVPEKTPKKGKRNKKINFAGKVNISRESRKSSPVGSHGRDKREFRIPVRFSTDFASGRRRRLRKIESSKSSRNIWGNLLPPRIRPEYWWSTFSSFFVIQWLNQSQNRVRYVAFYVDNRSKNRREISPNLYPTSNPRN